jgi:carboxyl-terminal processing protease
VFRTWPLLLGLLLGPLIFVAGLLTGRANKLPEVPSRQRPTQESEQQAGLLHEALQLIEQKFYSSSPLNRRAMTYGAVSGLLSSLGDPYTVHVEPPQRILESNAIAGEFGGIGVSIALSGTAKTVTSVSDGSPASKAGVSSDDIVLAVDGADVGDLGLDATLLLIRGEVGTPVRLELEREGSCLSVGMVRALVQLPSVTWELLPHGIAYVHVQSFSARTPRELSAALGRIREQAARALLLDLRGNGGGLVEGAADVLGSLIGHGIAYRELRKDESELRHPIPFDTNATELPIAVLVNAGTASAAEIVAAALQDHQRGLVFGEPTLGKGSMQGIFELQDGSSIHVTVARWLSSDGHAIEGVGVQPDIVVASAVGDRDGDLALQQALDYLDNHRESTAAGRPEGPMSLTGQE